MANVIFKRGLLANLPAQLTDGHVYVTTDERAMYIDYNDSGTVKRIRLGDFIEVANYDSLPSVTTASQTALYYVVSGNMLVKRGMVPNGEGGQKAGWVQINSQLTFSQLVQSIAFSASTESNNAKVVETVTGYAGAKVTGNMVFASGNTNALKVAGSGNTVTYTPKDVTEKASLGTPVYADEGNTIVEVKLTNTTTGTNADGSAVNTTAQGGSFKITGTNGTKVSIDDANNISITGGSVSKVSQTFEADGKLVTSVTAANGTVTNSANAPVPKIKYGDTGSSSATFNSGTATLNVYTKGEVDSKISAQLKAVNAMIYKGTVNGALPTSGVSVGDTYKVSAKATINGQQCKIGDMWIASAAEGKTEGSDGTLAAADIIWTYIPSGDEEIINYTGLVNDGQFMVKGGTNNILRVDEGTDIEITKVGSDSTVGKIAHATHTTGNTTGTAVTQQYNTAVTIPVITGLTVNNGHVDSIETTNYTLKDTHNDLRDFTQTVTTASNKASIQSIITMTGNTNKSATVSIGSSGSLAVTSTGQNITVDLQWGEF